MNESGQEIMEQQEQLVYALKRIDVDAANHVDVVVLAAALGLSNYLNPIDRRFDDEQIESNRQHATPLHSMD